MARRFVVPAPQKQADAVKGRAVRGDERVNQFRDGSEARQFPVERQPESLAARVAQDEEAGLGGAGTMSVGCNELYRALKLGGRDRGILRRHFLIRPVIDALARELLPVALPVAAEPAIAVIDQQRPGTGGRRFNGIGGLISGCLLHDFNYNWRRPAPRRIRSWASFTALATRRLERSPSSNARRSWIGMSRAFRRPREKSVAHASTAARS